MTSKKTRILKSPLLELRNITVLKGLKKILDSISLEIREGEHLAVLGPNGAGKSSLIKLITREYYPLLGGPASLLRIWGQERWDVFALRRSLGIVSYDLQHACDKDITGMEVVLSGFFNSIGLFKERITARMKRKAQKVVDFLEVAHLKGRKMDEMSSGEARRFLIGRALVHDPRALLLDEPTNSLDLHARHKLTDLLRKIARSGISIILVTHDLSDIIPEMGRVVLMRDGKLFKDGPTASVLTDKNMSCLFGMPLEVKAKDGYYYAVRG
jgi:iron complex transport system ATP-binding protein